MFDELSIQIKISFEGERLQELRSFKNRHSEIVKPLVQSKTDRTSGIMR